MMMKLKHLLPLTSLLGVSGPVLAHGSHAALPADSLLHLLAHHWPLLLVATAFALGLGLRGERARRR